MRTRRLAVGGLTSLVLCGAGLVVTAQASDTPPPQIPTCDKRIGTLAVTEPENNWWTQYQLDSPEALIKVFVSQSNCFTLLDRGKGLAAAEKERALSASGETRGGSNIGKGQMKAADYVLVPDLVTKNGNSGGTNIGGALGGFLHGMAGAVVGGISLKSKTADVVLTMTDVRSTDPLGFPEYQQRLKKAGNNAGEGDALLAVSGTLGDMPVALGVMDFAFMGGSMGSVVGEKISRLGQRSLERKYPMILVSASGGARMQEGVLALMQMAKAAAILSQLGERRIPFVSILTNPTMGGVSASYAMLGDAIIGEPGAVIGFAGPRVIKQTIGQDLPDGFQTAEFLLDHGMLDDVVHRKELKRTVGQLLRHMSGKPAAVGYAEP